MSFFSRTQPRKLKALSALRYCALHIEYRIGCIQVGEGSFRIISICVNEKSFTLYLAVYSTQGQKPTSLWFYFQVHTPHVKAKQLLRRKNLDGNRKVDIDIMMMLVCWNVEKRRKLDEQIITKKNGMSITSNRVEPCISSVKAVFDG